ncbi:DUF4328 domain-containing protein [Micromonospora terminaliae]|uniref:DUF4328 domain-containing protein n=1 Tax=Micromonospora terminaliae TaxID=1914461 RepID=A0AAJ3DHN3_9ACTN|nr:DUF4328 domain-containing protein [Micromonospora terminaliae]NES26762.1 DUF4328 domain-containing protein [Micromonospora terminaliae]QGL50918.1 DUF4328 domain-containing protein [Micromonospora terminaliae]
MHCQTCGADSSTAGACPRCGVSPDRPALSPGMPTFAVQGIGLAASFTVGLTALLYTLVALAPALRVLLAPPDGDPGRQPAPLAAEGLLSLAYVVVFLTAAVLVMVWMFRARKNTDAFPGGRKVLAAHWAITGWWVPVASLAVPCVVLVGIVRDSLDRVWLRVLVGVWWLAWLAFGIADLVTSLAEARDRVRRAEAGLAPDLDFYRDAALRNSVPALACLVAAAALVAVVLRVSAAQQARIDGAAWRAALLPSPVPAQPVTEPSPQVPGDVAEASPQVPGDLTVASPQVPPGPGGTIGA